MMAGSGTAQLRDGDMLLHVEHLAVDFGPAKRRVRAVSDVSFDVAPGETLGLVGESGCGKSTTGRAIAQVHRPDSGSVCFEGVDLTRLRGEELRRARTKLQMVFQDPISSLNPRRRVLDAVIEPLAIWGMGTAAERVQRARAMLEAVGVDPDHAGSRRPIEFSGGQCQRVSIARALMLEPRLLICDEPVSALDVSVQAQILNLLEDLKASHGLTMVFIAHDLAVVKNISDRVAVMYLGKLCEIATPDTLYREPAHHYTAALLASIPDPDPDAPSLRTEPVTGELPSPIDPPSGCRFRTRCVRAEERCSAEEPQMRAIGPGHFVACHFPLARPATAGSGGAAPGASAAPSPGVPI
jgi:peptide/nickel transport system ATP-binding protein